MKKILFVCYGLGIGGIERCLVNLINELDSNLYDIDLLLLNPEYDLLDEITNEVTLSGYVCKKPIYRQTPFDREISDLLLAVNRAYNKSD